MFSSRLVLAPTVGRTVDLRNALKAVTEHRQTTGARTTLTERIWAESGTSFQVVTLFETLAAAGESREKGPDAKTAQLIGEVTKHTAGTGQSSLWEAKVSSGPVGSNRPNYVLRARLSPANGKGAEVRKVLTNWCNSRVEAGQALGLIEQVWGAGGLSFVVRLPYSSIAEAESARAETNADPDYQNFVAELTPLLDRLAGWELDEVIVPMN